MRECDIDWPKTRAFNRLLSADIQLIQWDSFCVVSVETATNRAYVWLTKRSLIWANNCLIVHQFNTYTLKSVSTRNGGQRSVGMDSALTLVLDVMVSTRSKRFGGTQMAGCVGCGAQLCWLCVERVRHLSSVRHWRQTQYLCEKLLFSMFSCIGSDCDCLLWSIGLTYFVVTNSTDSVH